ncbi:MAG: ATP-dependent Clp protease proteolytic subunit [Candidatus Dormibacteria bacterium]
MTDLQIGSAGGAWDERPPTQAGGRARIFLSGELSSELAAQVAVQLMAHDAHSDDAVDLIIRSDQGTVAAALTVMDTIDAMGVPVSGVALGQVEGPALGVLAACHNREAAASSRLRLEAPVLAAQGTAESLAAQVRRAHSDLERFVARLATATGQRQEKIEIDLRQGRHFDPQEAIAYRLIDRIWTRG